MNEYMKDVRGEVTFFGVLSLAAMEITNGLFGFPIDVFQVAAVLATIVVLSRYVGHLFGVGQAREQVAVAAEFGEYAQKQIDKAKDEFDG